MSEHWWGPRLLSHHTAHISVIYVHPHCNSFYYVKSVYSNLFSGLQGIEMGNYLIKKVVQELKHELPSVNQFSSLSPIPGYRDWVFMQIHKHQQELG